jgi:tRNA pseudouridine13 synthase
LPEAICVTTVTRHRNKLRTGHLIGNRFRIRLVGVVPEAKTNAEAIAAQLNQRGMPNYYGSQRFGRDLSNLGQALQWLERQAESESGARSDDSRRRGKGKSFGKERFMNKLLPSVIQSEIFNRYLSRRRALDLGRLMPGEVVRLDGTGSLFVVEDVATEQPRLDARDVHLTGPIFGPKMRAAIADTEALERDIVQELVQDEHLLSVLGRHAPGTRRDLLVYPEIRVTEDAPGSLLLEFELPAGSYATCLVREFTRRPFEPEMRG